MAVDTYGTKGQPQFLDGMPPAVAVDPSAVANYAALVGNFIVGTTAQRTANVVPGTSTAVWEGLNWWDTDLKVHFRRIGGAWLDASVKQHAEFFFSRSAITDSVITLFSTSVDSGNTNDTAFATISGTQGQTVTLVQAGIYAVDFYFQVAAAPTGRFAGTIQVSGTVPSPTGVIAQASSPSGENALSCSIACLRATANTPLLFSVQKTTGSTADVSSRIRITRIGNF